MSNRKSMGVFEFIEKMQKKPEASRKKIVFLSSLAITALIFIFWLTLLSMPSSGNSPENYSPFASIKEDFSKTYDFFKENIGRTQ